MLLIPRSTLVDGGRPPGRRAPALPRPRGCERSRAAGYGRMQLLHAWAISFGLRMLRLAALLSGLGALAEPTPPDTRFAWIVAIERSGGGKTFQLKAQTYYIDRNYVLPDGTSIVGAGSGGGGGSTLIVAVATRPEQKGGNFRGCGPHHVNRIGFVLGSRCRIARLHYTGIERARYPGSHPMCGGAPFQTPGCATPYCENAGNESWLVGGGKPVHDAVVEDISISGGTVQNGTCCCCRCCRCCSRCYSRGSRRCCCRRRRCCCCCCRRCCRRCCCRSCSFLLPLIMRLATAFWMPQTTGPADGESAAGPSGGQWQRGNYTELRHTNCWTGHGGVNIDHGAVASTFTVTSCEAHCDATQGCHCVVMFANASASNGVLSGCWRRSSCVPAKCVATGVFNTWLKPGSSPLPPPPPPRPPHLGCTNITVRNLVVTGSCAKPGPCSPAADGSGGGGTWADGINIHGAHRDILVEGCRISHSGDDGLAMWSVGGAETGVAFVNNSCASPCFPRYPKSCGASCFAMCVRAGAGDGAAAAPAPAPAPAAVTGVLGAPGADAAAAGTVATRAPSLTIAACSPGSAARCT